MPVTEELARVRARFGIDPAVARPSLSEAWSSPAGTMEEDEAEFLDAVADCVSVGLSVEEAVASWGSGSLAYDAEETSDDDTADVPFVFVPHAPAATASGRRLLIR